MTQPLESPIAEQSQRLDKAQLTLEELVDVLKSVGEDVEQIVQLIAEENRLMTQVFDSLKHVEPLMSSITVSPSALPKNMSAAIQAHIDSTGHLILTYKGGQQKIINLCESNNHDLILAVLDDVVPKFKTLTTQNFVANTTQVLEHPKPPEMSVIAINPVPVSKQSPITTIETPVNVELPDSPPTKTSDNIQQKTPVWPADKHEKIAQLTAETLEYLEILGNEVFPRSSVGMYFDDWVVNLRQVILSFESSELIGSDETFTNECNQVFSTIEEELAKRLAADAEIEVSAKRLVENRYLLNKIDEGYAAQTKELITKGKSTIEYLTRNVRQLEAELAEVSQKKVSFRHPLQKLAKDQKISELTQKLNAAKKQLALAVGTSSVKQEKTEDIDAEYAAQTRELADKRQSAIAILSKEVHDLEAELVRLEKIKTSNPIKKTALAQKRFDTSQKLILAKKRLEIAEQNSNVEQEKLKAEYERKKQEMLGKMQTLEKDIAAKTIDTSAELRKEATKALANAVKALVKRKTTLSIT
ncbi:MAG: hypothetical protein N3D85_05765 [Candidatus Bathyarchaeota archaeon]|nr:hypothetical protein [Candidatus Bathyarchaeota archaeon]